MTEIVYAREQDLPVADYVEVISHSTLTRPIRDPERVATMLAGSSLIVSARLDGRCVGLARCLSDGAWVAYCADLAVDDRYQGLGIGRKLLETVKDLIGDGVGLALISVPDAIPFYEKMGPAMGFERNADAFWLGRTRGA
jgi:GNAT superfamily N-acetyltransferase